MRNWMTIGLFGVVIMQMVIAWAHKKKVGEPVWPAIRAFVFLLAGLVIIDVRERLGDIPQWADVALMTLTVILVALGVWSVFAQSRQHLQDVGLVEKKKQMKH